MQQREITLILSGGGARGIAHIAVIEALLKKGYVIRSISGTSMGALIGGVYAVGKLEEFKMWLLKVNKQKIFKLIDFSFSSQGLVKGDRIFNEIKSFITDIDIEKLPIAYNATAFDIANNREVVFDSGSLFQAIRASISIPTIFTPVLLNDAVFVDGGVVNNLPISNAIRTPNDLVIAVNVNGGLSEEVTTSSKIFKNNSQYPLKSLINSKDRKINYFTLINATLVTMTNHMSNVLLEKNPPDILIDISRNCAGIFEFYKAQEIIEIGEKAIINAMSEIEAKILF